MKEERKGNGAYEGRYVEGSKGGVRGRNEGKGAGSKGVGEERRRAGKMKKERKFRTQQFSKVGVWISYIAYTYRSLYT